MKLRHILVNHKDQSPDNEVDIRTEQARIVKSEKQFEESKSTVQYVMRKNIDLEAEANAERGHLKSEIERQIFKEDLMQHARNKMTGDRNQSDG